MMIPALSEFDVSLERGRVVGMKLTGHCIYGWLGMPTLVLSAILAEAKALFSLDQSSRQKLRAMGGSQADRLLNAPDQLLSAIRSESLINMTYFAIAAIVGDRLGTNRIGASRCSSPSLVCLSLFSLAKCYPRVPVYSVRIASLVGFPTTLAFQLVRPFLPCYASNQLAVGSSANF